MTSNRPTRKDRLSRQGTSRRRTLKLLGAAGVAGLAGCTGGDDGGSGDGGSGDGGSGDGGGGDGGDGGDGSSGGGTSTGSTARSDIAGQEVHFLKGNVSASMQSLMDEVKAEFERETGAILNMDYAGAGVGRWERMTQLLQAGTPPEIGSAQYSQGISLWREGVLEPVTEPFEFLTEKWGAIDDYHRLVDGGEDYFIPWTSGAGETWYRRDVLDAAGLDSGFTPQTWDDHIEYARAVDQNTDLNGVYLPASQSEPTQANVIAYMRANDAVITEYTGDDWEIALDQGDNKSRVVETLEYMQELHQYSPDAGGAGWTELINALAFETAGTSFYPGFKTKIAAANADRASGFAADVVNLGGVPEGRVNANRATTSPMFVFKGSNTEAAKEFLKFFYGNAEYAARFCWGDGPIHATPPYPGIQESDAQQELINSLPDTVQQEVIDRFWNEAPENGVVSAQETDPANPYMGAILGSLDVAGMVNDVLINDVSPSDAVDNRASNLRNVLENAK